MQVLKEDVRDNIKRAAVKCFKDVGYAKASMRDIAKDAGISVGNLYRYFPNKEAIFEECVKPAIVFFGHNNEPGIHAEKMNLLNVNLSEEIETLSAIIEANMVDRDALFLMLLRSEGSRYTNVKNGFIEFVKIRAMHFLEKEFPDNDVRHSEYYVHASASGFVEGFLVLLETAPDNETFIRGVIQYMELNVQAVIRYMLDVRDNKREFRRIDHEEIYRHFSGCGHRSGDSSAKSNG